jgi:leucyl aminopeptidase
MAVSAMLVGSTVFPVPIGSADVHVEATTASPLATDADTISVGVFEDEEIAHDLGGGELGALLESGEASPRFRRLTHTHAAERRFIVLGLGGRADFDAERARVAAAVVHERACELHTDTLAWEVPHHVSDAVVGGLVEGTLLHAHRFDRFRAASEEPGVRRLLVSAHHDVAGPVQHATALTTAQNRARDLGNSPANELTPAALARYAERAASGLDRLSVIVMDEAQIRGAGMGAFGAVAQGSSEPPRLIVLQYAGAPGDTASRLALVGKAVTFDSGGLSLKNPARMHEMKFDMAGGAAVIEAIVALAELGAAERVMGVVGATENLPSGTAVKPGDIVTALDGTTIEVDNTDAEGRLVLADCLSYAIRAGCDRVVDLATLTGGVVSALGSTYAGLMSNDDSLAAAVEACGTATGERVWRLPLDPDYAEMVRGRYAQLTNRSERREAFAITGAEFLHHFVAGTPWAHLDIAGTAYDVRRPYFADKGATGFGVRLLVQLALGSAVTPGS